MTYEGQIDETFGIKTNQVDVDCSILSSNYKPEPGQPTKECKKLSSDDIIFRQIRDKAYESLGFFFQEKIKEFESATDKSQSAVANIQQLQANVQKIKEMNIPVAKPLCDMHSNICYYIKQKNTQLNNKQCHQLEHLINHAESPKEITDALLTKMVRQTNIQTILRLMCLFSVTQSGLK